MARRYALCVTTRPFTDVLLRCRSLLCRLVHSAELCTDRQLHGSGRITRGNNDALHATCQRDGPAAARARPQVYERGRSDSRNCT
jgi:hypothetical protein